MLFLNIKIISINFNKYNYYFNLFLRRLDLFYVTFIYYALVLSTLLNPKTFGVRIPFILEWVIQDFIVHISMNHVDCSIQNFFPYSSWFEAY